MKYLPKHTRKVLVLYNKVDKCKYFQCINSNIHVSIRMALATIQNALLSVYAVLVFVCVLNDTLAVRGSAYCIRSPMSILDYSESIRRRLRTLANAF